MYLKVKYGEWRLVAESVIHPSNYEKSWRFECDYQAVSFLSKYPYLPTGIDLEAVALESFRSAEEECRKTNQRFRLLSDRPLEVDGDIRTVLWLACRKISDILGELDWEEFLRSTGWGPGATNVARGHHTSNYNKFSGPLSSTNGNLTLGLCCVNSTPAWAHYQSGNQPDDFEPTLPVTVLRSAVKVVKGGEIIFVPKNAKTLRTITVPVSLNSYVQKGFGKMIRRRLLHAGISLNDQSFNQMHALRGSLLNDRSTVDAKSASDTIATELVRFLLPEEWFDALYRAREPEGHLKSMDEWIRFHKFSAMGNSYTFELESLIFFALCSACVEVIRRRGDSFNPWTGRVYPSTVSVFGDDMVVPSDCYPLVFRVLQYAGFSINESKTHVEGPFRESCGKDYFHGNLVRPVFLKERLQNAEAVYKLANNIRRIAHRRSNYDGCDVTLRAVWLRIVNTLPDHQRRLRICEGFGDGGLISNWDEARPPRVSSGDGKHFWEGWRVRTLLHVPVKERMYQYQPSLAAYLRGESAVFQEEHGLLDRRISHPVALRDLKWFRELPVEKDCSYDLRGRTRLKVGPIVVDRWYDLGPWV